MNRGKSYNAEVSVGGEFSQLGAVVNTNEVIWGNKFIGKSLSHKQWGRLVVCYGA